MTHYVNRGTINEQSFAQAVALHVDDLYAYEKHMQRVRKGEPGVQAYPPPRVAPDIDNAVRREVHSDGTTSFHIDYQFVEGTYVPAGDEKAFALRKEELKQQIAQMELTSVHAILPAGKWRYSGYQYQLAGEARNNYLVAAEKKKRGQVASEASKVSPEIKQRWLEETRLTPEEIQLLNTYAPEQDNKVIEEHNARLTRHRAVQLYYSKLESDLEDLTFETINSWQPQPYNEN